jgi:hypothetical protein
MKEWDTERKELLEQIRQAETTGKYRKEELERRHAAQQKEEKEHKLEHVRHAKTAMEKNPDALRESDLVVLSSMKDLLVVWFIQVIILLLCSHVLNFFYHLLHLFCCHLLHLP